MENLAQFFQVLSGKQGDLLFKFFVYIPWNNGTFFREIRRNTLIWERVILGISALFSRVSSFSPFPCAVCGKFSLLAKSGKVLCLLHYAINWKHRENVMIFTSDTHKKKYFFCDFFYRAERLEKPTKFSRQGSHNCTNAPEQPQKT